ncbi:MAG: hypothetical protein H0X34_09645 [Chthoniobacterales bacterium]|nr:hypothetical protein [Chthoniobacterales bacterium]
MIYQLLVGEIIGRLNVGLPGDRPAPKVDDPLRSPGQEFGKLRKQRVHF